MMKRVISTIFILTMIAACYSPDNDTIDNIDQTDDRIAEFITQSEIGAYFDDNTEWLFAARSQQYSFTYGSSFNRFSIENDDEREYMSFLLPAASDKIEVGSTIQVRLTMDLATKLASSTISMAVVQRIDDELGTKVWLWDGINSNGYLIYITL